MKAKEVLRRYENGERDFRGVNLRGQSFKGQDLSGADFSGADIRSANFTNAKLSETNFSGVTAGLQRRWMVLQLFLAISLYTFLDFVPGVFNGNFIGNLLAPNFIENNGYAAGMSLLVAIAGVAFAVVYQGLTFKASITIGVAGVVVGAVVSISLILEKGINTVGNAIGIALVGFFVVGIAFAVAIASTIAGIGTSIFIVIVANTIGGAIALAIASISAIGVIGIVPFAVARDGGGIIKTVVAGIGVGTIALLSLYIAWRTFRKDKKFSLVHTNAVAFGAWVVQFSLDRTYLKQPLIVQL